SFYAEKRGASSVFATDDISQNWSTEKEYISRRRYSDQRSKSIRIFLFMISPSSKENSTLFSASASTTIWSIHSLHLRRSAIAVPMTASLFLRVPAQSALGPTQCFRASEPPAHP